MAVDCRRTIRHGNLMIPGTGLYPRDERRIILAAILPMSSNALSKLVIVGSLHVQMISQLSCPITITSSGTCKPCSSMESMAPLASKSFMQYTALTRGFEASIISMLRRPHCSVQSLNRIGAARCKPASAIARLTPAARSRLARNRSSPPITAIRVRPSDRISLIADCPALRLSQMIDASCGSNEGAYAYTTGRFMSRSSGIGSRGLVSSLTTMIPSNRRVYTIVSKRFCSVSGSPYPFINTTEWFFEPNVRSAPARIGSEKRPPISEVIKPIRWLEYDSLERRSDTGRYPICSATSRTSRRVETETRPLSFNALDAVDTDTWATAATWARVTRRLPPPVNVFRHPHVPHFLMHISGTVRWYPH